MTQETLHQKSGAFLTTEQLAAEIHMQPQSIRKRWSQTGSFWNVIPLKLPNRKLAWPIDAVRQLMNRGEQ